MDLQEALNQLENTMYQKRCAASLLLCLGIMLRQDEVVLTNLNEAILGIYEFLNTLFEQDSTAIEAAVRAARP